MNKQLKVQLVNMIKKLYPAINEFTGVQVLPITKKTKLAIKEIIYNGDKNILFYYRQDIDKLYMNDNIDMENYL